MLERVQCPEARVQGLQFIAWLDGHARGECERAGIEGAEAVAVGVAAEEGGRGTERRAEERVRVAVRLLEGEDFGGRE